MKTIEPKILKGFRDFLPKEARKRQYVIEALKKVFESYGFEPLETPALEYEEVLLGKYGDEGDKLMYRFVDNGKRKVALRYDQTVPLARVVAQYQNRLSMPFKRYQIQNVWRAENPQKGRFREFLQCDIDIVGSSSPLSDAEILSLVYDAYDALGLDIQILINDRQQLSTIKNKYLSSIDKVGKIETQEIIRELESKGLNSKEAKQLFGKIQNVPESDSLKKVKSVFVSIGNPKDILQYQPTLVRGLDYYTGFIFEVVLKDKTESLSLGGGGRYDNLIGMFAGKQIPAVGFAFGFDRLMEAMEELKLFPKDLQTTKVLVTLFSQELLNKSAEVTAFLREKGINTEIYLDVNAKMEKQLKYADKKQIPYVIIIGPNEISKNSLTLKNMKTGEQKVIPQERLITELNNL